MSKILYTGYIASYLKDKHYGFIKYNDLSVFFHDSDVDPKCYDNLAHGAVVNFDLVPTPKGYSAKKITIVDNKSADSYILNEKTLIFSNNAPSQYTILYDMPEVMILGLSRHGGKKAKEQLVKNLEKLGFNGGYNCSFFTQTKSEPGTGRGTHYYTESVYKCTPCILGIKSMQGNFRLDDINPSEYEHKIDQLLIKHEKLQNIKLIAVNMIFAICAFILYSFVPIIKYSMHSKSLFTILILCFVWIVVNIVFKKTPLSWIAKQNSKLWKKYKDL